MKTDFVKVALIFSTLLMMDSDSQLAKLYFISVIPLMGYFIVRDVSEIQEIST